jgi:hypothetical protein
MQTGWPLTQVSVPVEQIPGREVVQGPKVLDTKAKPQTPFTQVATWHGLVDGGHSSGMAHWAVQTPLRQVPILQPVPSGSGVWAQPTLGSQLSVVHSFPSSQLIGV